MPDAAAVRLLIASDEGGSDERVVTLPVAFGRDPGQADVVLPDRMVSRCHARLEADGDRLVLVDLESANGTWIGEDRVERRLLDPDDVVTLGTHTVRWAHIEPAPASPVAAEPRPAPTFGAAGGVVLGSDGLRFLPLAELHAAWHEAERRLGEIAEELARDGVAGDPAARLDAHDRCVAALDELLDTELERAAPPTIALCVPNVAVAQFHARVRALRGLPAHGVARRASGAARGRDDLTDGVAAVLLEEDRRLVDALSDALGDALDAFADHGADVTRQGAARLMGGLRAVLVALGEADRRLAERVREAGLAPAGTTVD